MRKFDISYFTESRGDATNLNDVLLPDLPPEGTTLILTEQLRCRPTSSGIGTVTEVVMKENSPTITLMVKEKK